MEGKRVAKTVLTLVIIGVFVGVALFPAMELVHVDCTRDYTHEATQQYNEYLAKNVELRYGL